MEAIVQEAGVTRGALYHHFDGKQGLFEAVVARKQAEAGAYIREQAGTAATPWDGFIAGCYAWLAASADPEFQRIVIMDAPAVLGWKRWLQIDAEYGAVSLREGLDELADGGIIAPPSIEALANLLNGALNQAALWIAQSSNPQSALREAESTLLVLLEGVRTH